MRTSLQTITVNKRTQKYRIQYSVNRSLNKELTIYKAEENFSKE